MKTTNRTSPARRPVAVALLAITAFLGSFTLAGADSVRPAPAPEGQPPALAPIELSLAGHPQADYYLHDPSGQAIRAEFETGWQAVQTGKAADDIGWMPTAFLFGPVAPERDAVTEVVDSSGELFGYWGLDGSFTPVAEFDSDNAGPIFRIPWPE